jgi:hypothetical protein
MNPVAAFFFGILVVFIIFVPFWLLANTNPSVNTAYKNSVCFGVCSFSATPAIGGNPQTSTSIFG